MLNKYESKKKVTQRDILNWVKTLKPHEFVFFMHKAMEVSQLQPKAALGEKDPCFRLVLGKSSKHTDNVWRTTYYALPEIDRNKQDPDKLENYQTSSFPENSISEVADCSNCLQESISWCKRMTCPVCHKKLTGS